MKFKKKLIFFSSSFDFGVSADRGGDRGVVPERAAEGVAFNGRHDQERRDADDGRVGNPVVGRG